MDVLAWNILIQNKFLKKVSIIKVFLYHIGGIIMQNNSFEKVKTN